MLKLELLSKFELLKLALLKLELEWLLMIEWLLELELSLEL